MSLLAGCCVFAACGAARAQQTAATLVRLDLPAELPSAEAAPQPAPVSHDTERGDFDLALGLSYLRFRSSLFTANTYGLKTNFTYFVTPWIGAEGDINSGFGSQSSSSATAKSVLYGAGVRIAVPRERLRFRPWGHVLLGGIHMFPQTGLGNNGFATQLGGGVDLHLRRWLWLRMQGDYVRSQLYSAGQNNLQIATSIVYRF